MKHKQRAQFERALLAEREKLSTLVDGGDAAFDSTAAVSRLGDEASPSVNGTSDEDDRAVAAHAARELASIDGALRLLHDAPLSYGVCSTCAKEIPIERLRLVPGTHSCQLHARDS